MKYTIGQQVWHAGWDSFETRLECPDCAGEGRIRVLLPDNDVVSVDCVACQSGYARPCGYLTVHERKAVATLTTITGVEIEQGKTKWRTSDHYRVSEDHLFDTEAEAQAAASAIAAAADLEERERVGKKHKDTRSWAWNARYHRKCIKEAQRQIEYHTSKLSVASIKAKADKNTTI
ncbi:hypothetical protein HU230_0012630 [Bradyrhizobium quebecense]|uniref:Uncharacterized protein n=1 Tax=Bradyrhizobium quebecense TaxID=2748629 RepID=A0A973WN11_9BRAD|nr:hypothetical protein [Bradyrhizobium quebecense]UGA46835.1 hypothetical protein HU230_0012630 [Bradyrhizobium quebecense]